MNRMRDSVLMIAFHFPPFKGSSGVERTLGFCKHLPSYGWRPLVLSADTKAYEKLSPERLGDISPETVVERAFARDCTRHFAIRKRYPRFLALPDRWASWAIGGIARGLAMIKRHRPKALWSTYPIATAHIIGYALHRLSGLPWVVDFRDPMVEFDDRKQEFAPRDSALRGARLWVERLCASRASMAIFCTRGAAEIFMDRYPGFPSERVLVIPNGFDEGAFAGRTGRGLDPGRRGRGRPLLLLHSGVLYPGPDRDPTAFLSALASFLRSNPEWRGRLQVVLRATGFDHLYAPAIDDLGLRGVVSLQPLIPYREAIEEMHGADVLLIFQGYTSNPAIPAKLYEYIRVGRPVLALVDDEGETANLLRTVGGGTLVPIDNASAIEAALPAFLESVVAGTAPVVSSDAADLFERRHRAREFAQCLSEVAVTRRAAA